MKRIKISADLERRLRAATDSLEGLKGLVAEVTELLDENSAKVTPPVGLGYKELVSLFRTHLGAALALPPNPSTGWIIRQVARARDLGLDGESIRRICEEGRRSYPRGAIELEFLLRIAPRLLAAPEVDVGGGTGHLAGTVHTGRGAQDDD